MDLFPYDNNPQHERVKVNKMEYIRLSCQLDGLFQYEKAKILEIKKTIDFRFF